MIVVHPDSTDRRGDHAHRKESTPLAIDDTARNAKPSKGLAFRMGASAGQDRGRSLA
jgi:hypothetical protein